MRFEAFRTIYQTQSERASAVTRQLAFAGLAIVWILRDEVGKLPPSLHPGALLLVIGLACDLIQYALTTWLYHCRYMSLKGRAGDEGAALQDDTEVVVPAWLHTPGRYLFAAKIGLVIAAYGCILVYLSKQII